MFEFLLLPLAVGAYCVGSLPIHRFFGLADIDDPATAHCRVRSVLRVFLNILKGYSVVYFGSEFGTAGALTALFAVSLGHNFPFWSSFRGGTGLGAILGAALALDPMLGLLTLASWTFAYYSFLHRAAAAVCASVMAPAAAGFLELPFSPVILLPLTALIIWRHRVVVLGLHLEGPKETEDHFRRL